MKRPFTFLIPTAFMLYSFGPSAKVEQVDYSVFMDGYPIGSYTVNKTVVASSTTFNVETNTAAGLLSRTAHRFLLTSSYDGEQLISADMKTWVNEKLESSSTILWDGNQYVHHQDEQITEICEQLVSKSSVMLFFEEPVDQTQLFYEKYGRELLVVNKGDHTYEIELPNGTKERYKYVNGKVEKVEFVQSFTTITLHPV